MNDVLATPPPPHSHSRATLWRAWLPWIILSVVVFLWGLPQMKAFLDGLSVYRFPIDGLDKMIQRVPPVVAKPAPEGAVYVLNWLSATGTGILISALIAGKLIGASFGVMGRVYLETLVRVRFSLLTIAAMLALGFTTRYSGLDATLGLAFAQTGLLYPILRDLARMGRRRAHRVRHGVERAVRQPAADLVGAARAASHPHGRGEQLGRGDGQDDRRAVASSSRRSPRSTTARRPRSCATCSGTRLRSPASSACW